MLSINALKRLDFKTRLDKFWDAVACMWIGKLFDRDRTTVEKAWSPYLNSLLETCFSKFSKED